MRILTLEHRLDVAEECPPPAGESADARPVHFTAARCRLCAARRAIADIEPWWRRFSAWWTGSAITVGWQSVHEAEAELTYLESDEKVRAKLPALLAWMQEVMESGSQRMRYERQLTEFIDGAPKRLDRAVVRQAYEDVISANGTRHANTRAFRNGLAVVTSVFALLLVALAIWHAIDTSFISLCGTTDEAQRCLSGSGSDPRPADVAMVMLVGAVGGLLASAFGLGSLETPPSRYDPRFLQAALKPVAGAATGLVGVLLVQSDILIAPAGSTSESLLLAYAAIFGFSQQLLTRFVDKRAGQLLGEEETDRSTAAKA